MLPLLYDTNDRIHRANTMLQLPMMYIVRKGGYLPYSFAVHPVMPVRYKDDKPSPAPHWNRPGTFDYARHVRFYDYFLAIYGPGSKMPYLLPSAGESVQLVKRRGRFALYRNLGQKE